MIIKCYSININKWYWILLAWIIQWKCETGKVGLHAACHYQNQSAETGITSFFFIVVRVQLSPFSPHPPPPITLNSTPRPHWWLCPWAFYTCSLMTLSLLFPVISLPTSSGYCLFLISMSLVIFCLLVCFVD